MVDCSRQRCVQERRSFRRELLTWVKKVPILVGLEEVTRTILGEDVSTTLLQPFYNLEPSVADDWAPQTKCQFCEEETPFSDDILQQTSDELSEIDHARTKFLQHISQLNRFTLTPDEPLDLSASSSHSDTDEIQTSQNPVELKVPQIHSKHGKRRENCGKRNYTEEELTAAVSDIRSGKLGTRRAAALYGVPRSTLRNKIFRLDTGSPQSWLTTDTLPQATELPPEFFHDGHLVTEYGEWEKKLQQLRRKHDLGAGHKRPFGMPPLFFSNEHFLECQKAFGCSNPHLYDLKLPFLQQLVRKLTKERVGARSLWDDQEPHCGVATGDAAEIFSGSSNNVELQIPSYKPMRNNKSEEEVPVNNGRLALGIVDCARPNKTIGESLKDIIVKSIAQKVRSRVLLNNANKTAPASEPKFAVSCENGHWEAPLRKDSEAAPEAKKMKLAMKSSKAVATSDEDDGKHGRRQKQTRPKRGQYRKYNSQLLMEAVQSVQRGEMSVHRAGSFYGVPHSTLEYKVKERHLLRQKKARENQKKSCDDPTSDRRSTSDDNAALPDETSSSAGEDPANLPLYPLSGYVPLSLGWPPFSKGSTGVANIHATGFPPYGGEFGLNTSASELLKKLQQKVQANSALETAMNDEVETTDSIVVSAGDAQVTVK